MEDDKKYELWRAEQDNFNPRPPHGGRPINSVDFCPTAAFQSTSSAWRTTNYYLTIKKISQISIHVLRMEDDYDNTAEASGIFVFQSTSSAWRTTIQLSNVMRSNSISIHVLRMEDDLFHI